MLSKERGDASDADTRRNGKKGRQACLDWQAEGYDKCRLVGQIIASLWGHLLTQSKIDVSNPLSFPTRMRRFPAALTSKITTLHITMQHGDPVYHASSQDSRQNFVITIQNVLVYLNVPW